MDPAEALAEIEAIKRLKYRYVRCLDQKLWDEIEECMTDDASASYGGGAFAFEGRAAIVDFLREAMGSEGFLSSHQVSQPEIDLTSDTTATGTWKLDDVVIQTDHAVVIRGAAFYTDEYVKVAGAWRIRTTGYRRLYEEMEPRSADARITASWWVTDGRSTLMD